MRPTTVSSAIDRYLKETDRKFPTRRTFERLRDWFGDTPLDLIRQEDADAAAMTLFPTHAVTTRINNVYLPLRLLFRRASIDREIRLPPRPKPKIRALTREAADQLVGCTDDPDFAALLVFLFYSGARISEAMTLTPESLDWENRRVRLRLAYRDIEVWRPLHPKAARALRTLPPRKDRVFRWRIKAGPERHLKQLREKSGIYFTYTMARYSFASWLAEEGANLRDIMDAGGWGSPSSVLDVLDLSEPWIRETIEAL